MLNGGKVSVADIMGDGARRADVRIKRAGGRQGGGARFAARDVQTAFGVCRRRPRQRWGGPFTAAGAAGATWEGAESLRVFTSSDWTERGLCGRRGSRLFYRITFEEPHQGACELPEGLFDDPTGLRLAQEIHVAARPEASASVPGLHRLTETQWLEKLGVAEMGEGGA
jgi:hypothetical protein